MRKDVLAFICGCVIVFAAGAGTIVANSQSTGDTSTCTSCHEPSVAPSEMAGYCSECHNTNNPGSTPDMTTGECEVCHNVNRPGTTPSMIGSCEACHGASTQKAPTAFSSVVAPALVSNSFTLNGVLKASNGMLLPSATVQLQTFIGEPSNEWKTIQTVTLNAEGMYSFAVTETTPGSYQYRVYYEGSTSAQSQTSNVVSVTFVNKASVANDAKALLERMEISPKDFTTSNNYNTYANKLNALAQTINAGNYAEAQAKIQNDLMKRSEQWVTDPAVKEKLTNELGSINSKLSVL